MTCISGKCALLKLYSAITVYEQCDYVYLQAVVTVDDNDCQSFVTADCVLKHYFQLRPAL